MVVALNIRMTIVVLETLNYTYGAINQIIKTTVNLIDNKLLTNVTFATDSVELF